MHWTYLDLASANDYALEFSIQLGSGDETFGPFDVHTVDFPVMSIAAGDLYGNGDLDLAVATGERDGSG